ncbi:hypothetical protein Q7C36_012045 [Tachysurus vachellii]|uniref:Uncharacterized protein n=1 Tax=Tachysurus vachellii TaxID=175792 RepID=A0AA88MRV8_TACVA|nr:hypothetical protein Q7C36_012045 [Tachysurus vachellii]
MVQLQVAMSQRCGQAKAEPESRNEQPSLWAALWNRETGGGLMDPPFNVKAKGSDHDGGRKYMFHDRFSIILHGELP